MANGNTVGHNTNEMRKWSGDIETAAQDYNSYIKSLYSLVDTFVASDFTGGLSEHFYASVMNQRQHFDNLTKVLEEVSDCVKNTSTVIDRDEAELKQMMDKSNFLG